MQAAGSIAHPSPNFNARPDGQQVDMLVLHYTNMPTAELALARLCDPAAEVSAHYLIDEDGQVLALVNEEKRAWHAGVAAWAGQKDINGCSIGIELAHIGHHEDGSCDAFPAAQMTALAGLAADIIKRHPIPPHRVLAHSDVAPGRKIDPGEAFDWMFLAGKGIGLWPTIPRDKDAPRPLYIRGDRGTEITGLQRALASFGYALTVDGDFGVQTEFVIRAFQRHYRPWQVDGHGDHETVARLMDLLAQLG